jgi:riboflavin biosynthesis pyrimidine reductase
MSADGKATLKGAAKGIGGESDHAVMQQLRIYADAIMSGVGTLLAEDIVPRVDATGVKARQSADKPEYPRAMTLTSRADLPFAKHFFDLEYRPVVFFDGDDRGDLDQHAQVMTVAGDRAIDEIMTKSKHELGVDLLLLEGGPRLNQAFLQAGVVDEFFITLAPKLIAKSGISIVEGDVELNLDLQLVSSQVVGDTVFLRYKLGQK